MAKNHEDTWLHQYHLYSKSNKIYYVQSPKVGRKKHYARTIFDEILPDPTS